MVGLVRSGPKLLLIETDYLEELANFLVNDLEANEYDINTAFEKAGEDYTILFLMEKMNNIVDKDDVKDTLIIREEPDVILCRLINSKKTNFMKNIRIAPRIIIARAIGNIEKALREIKNDYGGQEGSFLDLLNSHNENGIIVALTEKPLNRIMSISELYERALFIEGKYYDFLKELRLHALKYLNTGLENKDWHELEIRIYDSYGAFRLHYNRLMLVLEAMELGIVLGESWSKDYPRVLMSIDVYRVRFFTFNDPQYIKKILLGLEYLENGMRIVDYDVYLNRKKLYWSDTLNDGKRSRSIIGAEYRKEIHGKLTTEEISELHSLEKEILESRR